MPRWPVSLSANSQRRPVGLRWEDVPKLDHARQVNDTLIYDNIICIYIYIYMLCTYDCMCAISFIHNWHHIYIQCSVIYTTINIDICLAFGATGFWPTASRRGCSSVLAVLQKDTAQDLFLCWLCKTMGSSQPLKSDHFIRATANFWVHHL